MGQYPTAAPFETTQWSAVVAAPGNPRVLEKLLTAYWGPIYAYIRRSGRSRDESADLAQQFITEVVLERGLLERAAPERGRFRTFLKTALRNFLIDQHRRTTSCGRSPATPLAGGAALDRLEPAQNDEPADAFDRQWAATLLSLVLERLEADCAACGQQSHWAAFHAAVIDPALGHDAAPALDALATRLSVGSASQVSSMIQTVRRKFRRLLRDTVSETLADNTCAEDEIASLRQFLNA